MLARGAESSDHLPSLQATFLTRLLDIRTASSYTSMVIGPPKPVNLQAFAQSFEHRNHETNWPPPPLAGVVGGTLSEGYGGSTPIATASRQLQGSNPVLQPTPGDEMPFDLNSLLGLSSNIPNAGGSDSFRMSDVVEGKTSPNLFESNSINPFPDVPVASLGLTMGNFMNDQGVMDVLFANDGLW